MPTLTLRILEASGFVTKGSALTMEEWDSNFIQLKAEIDAVSETLDQFSGHVQNTDTFLAYGTANQVAASALKVLLGDIPIPAAGNSDDQLWVNSAGSAYEIRKNAHIYAYALDNATSTNITTNDTPTDIGGTLSVAYSDNMSASGTGIQNDSSDNKRFEVVVQASVKMDTAEVTDLELVCKVQASVQSGRCTIYGGNDTNERLMVWTGIVEMDVGEVFQPQLVNISGTNDLTATQLQITMKSIN